MKNNQKEIILLKDLGMQYPKTKHKLTKHKIYFAWSNMIGRCTNRNNPIYKYYGERGIKVCDEWKNDFMSFYNWSLENGYQENLTIDRINNDGNYEPNNCRWVYQSIQSQNTRIIRSNNTSGYRGVCFAKSIKKWKAQLSVESVHINIGYFDTKEDAAKAYNNYVIDNKLSHNINKI